MTGESPASAKPQPVWKLRPGRCRYPVREVEAQGRPLHLFCGSVTGDVVRAYCPDHAALAYESLGARMARRAKWEATQKERRQTENA